jgi:capsular polysaccharide transport system permease protein
MLSQLQKTKKLRQHYEQPQVDWFSRLSPQASSEETFEYYRDMVRVDHDSNSGVVTLKVRAFSTPYAHELAEAVLAYSEEMVNKLSERARNDQTRAAETEVQKAELRLTQARQAIVELQQEHGDFSPEKTATEALSLRGALKGELAQARAELMDAKAFMQPGAPKVVALRQRVNSLSAQVTEESRRLVNPKDEKGLNTSMAKFEAALVEKEFAQGAYESALASLEVSRAEAMRQNRYLATIAKPSAPDEETHPRRLRAVVTVVVLSAMLLGIFSLLVAAVREHARI